MTEIIIDAPGRYKQANGGIATVHYQKPNGYWVGEAASGSTFIWGADGQPFYTIDTYQIIAKAPAFDLQAALNGARCVVNTDPPREVVWIVRPPHDNSGFPVLVYYPDDEDSGYKNSWFTEEGYALLQPELRLLTP